MKYEFEIIDKEKNITIGHCHTTLKEFKKSLLKGVKVISFKKVEEKK